MFLPENSCFPPREWTYIIDKWNEYKAWYSSDPEQIIKYNVTKLSDIYCISDGSFWKQIQKEDCANAVHLPSAADISSTSANLLFSEPPVFTYNKDSQAGIRIDDFMEENGFLNFLLESSEIAAALSGCYLKLDIDLRLSSLPIISVMTPLQAFPTFLRGRLWEVLFYRVVKTEKEGTIYYRLFENRKRINLGKDLEIEYRLYKGSNDKVGHVIDLNSIEETKDLDLKPEVYKNIDGLGVVYVPNLKPNKLMIGSPIGANDFGIALGMMDSLDLAWNSWIRDIELGMGQIFVDEELLIKEEQSIFGDNKTMLNKFSKFEKCFINLNLSNYKMSGDNVKPIECSQFEMRVEEHLKSCNYFWTQTVGMCGYSPSTFGLDIEGRAESGTALRIRERKSFLTREKKARYWSFAIKQILLQMQKFDNIIKSYQIEENLKVELEDSIIIDQNEQSEIIKNLDTARAISTYMKVKMQHNDWDEDDIEKEVKKIYTEENMNSTNIFDDENPINLDNFEDKNKNNGKTNEIKDDKKDLSVSSNENN